MPGWLVATCLVVGFVMLVLIVLQTIYVRVMMSQYEQERVRDLDDSADAHAAADALANVVRVYGLVVDCGATRALNAAARLDPGTLRDAFRPQAARDSTMVGCGATAGASTVRAAAELRMVEIEFEDMLWLVLRPNAASAALRADLAAARTKYLAIADTVYVAHWAGETQQKLSSALKVAAAGSAALAGITRAAQVLDAGSGGGAVAVAISRVHSGARVSAVSASPRCDAPAVAVRFFRFATASASESREDPLMTEVSQSSELVLVALGFRVH